MRAATVPCACLCSCGAIKWVFPVIKDVKNISPDVLRHRIILAYEAEAQAVTTDAIIKKVFNSVPVP